MSFGECLNYLYRFNSTHRVVVRSLHTPLCGVMVKILDMCWNFTIQHQFWIKILWIYNEYIASEENPIPRWNFRIMHLSGRFTLYVGDQVSKMLHFELLQSSYQFVWSFVLHIHHCCHTILTTLNCSVWNGLMRGPGLANHWGLVQSGNDLQLC